MPCKSLKPKNGLVFGAHISPPHQRKEGREAGKEGEKRIWHLFGFNQSYVLGAYYVQGILLGVMGNKRYMRGSPSSKSLLSRERRHLSIISHKIRHSGYQYSLFIFSMKKIAVQIGGRGE